MFYTEQKSTRTLSDPNKNYSDTELFVLYIGIEEDQQQGNSHAWPKLTSACTIKDYIMEHYSYFYPL